jgi:hypothetical protein
LRQTGISFATGSDGWLTGACSSLADVVLAIHNGIRRHAGVSKSQRRPEASESSATARE